MAPSWFVSLTQHSEKPPWLLKYRSSNAFIIATISLAVFTDMFLYGVIVPVIPFALEARSHIVTDRVQYWVSVLVAIYAASLLAFSPICGWLADRSSSRRSSLLIGLFALLGATVMLNVGASIAVLIIGRLLQGASAAVVWVVGLALLADTVPQENLAQSMGYVGLGMSVGILIAPLLGGVVYDRAGYNAVFAMAYALVGFDIILRLLLVEKKVAARWASDIGGRQPVTAEATPKAQGDPEKNAGAVDSSSEPHNRQAISLSASTTDPGESLTTAEEAPVSGPSDGTTHETASPVPRKRRRDRLPPIISLLYSRRLLAALFAAIVQASIVTSFDSVLTIHAANTFGWTSTGAALLFLPIVIPTFAGPLFGWLSDQYGGRYFTGAGFLLACPPLVCLRFIQYNTLRDKVLLCALLALVGIFLTLTFPPIMAEISAVVEAKEKKMLANGEKGYGKGGAYAQAYALFNVAFAAGCMIGPLLAGFIVQEQGWSTMAWVLGLLSAITAVPAFLWMGGFILDQKT